MSRLTAPLIRSAVLLLACAVWAQADPITHDSGAADTSLHADAEMAIPAPLVPWIDWVLEQGGEVDRRACPFTPDGERRCAWPGRLELDLGPDAGRFAQEWQLFAATWVALPGDAGSWPQSVTDAGRPLPVVLRGSAPAVKLAPGRHTLAGRFDWPRYPDALAVPATTGLIALRVEGQARPLARPDRDGRLWLRQSGAAPAEAQDDRLQLEVYRRIEDSLPLRVLTRLELAVSGRAREVWLGPVTLAAGAPLRLTSQLPAQLDPDGRLRVQVRPGRWVLEVDSSHPGAVGRLARQPRSGDWPEQEVWAFAAHPELRQVETGGLTPLDPHQVSLPDGWSALPLFRAGPDQGLDLVEQRRGDADPEPDRLTLSRDLWLDFDGGGYSVRDRIGGDLTRRWRLESTPALALGQVQVGGSPVLIDRLGEQGAPGVEVRRGQLDLVADGRMASASGQLPALGWDATFESAQVSLHLPPGWSLLAATGVDNLPDTWLTRWTLLDLFLVLVLSIGVWRLWGLGWGALALAALALTWQSPGAPQLVWVHLLVAAALLRAIPSGTDQVGTRRLRLVALWYLRASLLGLLVLGLPFLVAQVRNGIYPQLAQPGLAWSGGSTSFSGFVAPPAAEMAEPQSREMLNDIGAAVDSLATRSKSSVPAAPAPPRRLPTLDPDARVQTGAGIPDWHWQAVELGWTGPVARQDLGRLWLLTPAGNLAVALLGALLIALLALRVSGLVPAGARARTGAMLVLAAGLVAGAAPETGRADEPPSPELLQDLRARLLAPPDCLPGCVELPRLELRAESGRLRLALTLDAAARIAAPLPGGADWSPDSVLLDEAPVGLGRDPEGRLLVPLTPGRHQLVLDGELLARQQVELAFPLQPRAFAARAEGWEIEGLDQDGRPGAQIQLVRLAAAAQSADQPLTQQALAPLLLVERRLAIGKLWEVETRVRRLSAPEFPLLMAVPLLPGESVQTAGPRVEGGQIQVALPAGGEETGWTSRLDPVSELVLSASTDSRLAESWILDLSPLWHLEVQGIPPVHPRGGAETWLPTWRPLPGERLTLNFGRPSAVPGPTLTIDRVDYQSEPGRRGRSASLSLALRSSQGGRHLIRLPEGAEPLRLAVDGRSLPVPAAGSAVELPLIPGAQRFQLDWREPAALAGLFRPASPDLGSPAVNLRLAVTLPGERWILFASGPRLGPAVLFWGLLLILTGLAVALGRSRLTPLRTHDWFLLGVGLGLSEVWVGLVVAGWLFALGLRQRQPAELKPWRFNLTQIGLVLLTLAALAALLGAVQQGLLGRPDMQIMGNGSYGNHLLWYQDRGGPGLPEVAVVSVPMWIYRGLMLGWSLWLALRLLDWLRWGWHCFAQPQLWCERRRATPAATAAGS